MNHNLKNCIFSVSKTEKHETNTATYNLPTTPTMQHFTYISDQSADGTHTLKNPHSTLNDLFSLITRCGFGLSDDTCAD